MEILSTVSSGTMLFGVILMGILSVVAITAGLIYLHRGDLGGVVGLILAVFWGGITYVAAVDYVTPRYEVTITDMSRFDTDKYQIIEQRGKVFVVKEIRR
ncbi:hypothetical protein ABE137_03860 [Brevibacillus laterosporus]|uniref:hypothetical protein n=1 Tax=Brevibacillus laterosporus TaxID=1465 RepID=UPI003D203206